MLFAPGKDEVFVDLCDLTEIRANFKWISRRGFIGIAHHAKMAKCLVFASDAGFHIAASEGAKPVHLGRIVPNITNCLFVKVSANVFLPSRAGVDISVAHHAAR